MTIVDKRKNETSVLFSKIKIGDTFHRPGSSEIYMRTEDVYEITYYEDEYWGWYDKRKMTIANAICLNNGKQKVFYDTEAVVPVKCECVIKE